MTVKTEKTLICDGCAAELPVPGPEREWRIAEAAAGWQRLHARADFPRGEHGYSGKSTKGTVVDICPQCDVRQIVSAAQAALDAAAGEAWAAQETRATLAAREAQAAVAGATAIADRESSADGNGQAG